MIYYAILCFFAGGITNVTETLCALLGFLLLTMSYISFGGFISSLTDNQIISGILTVILLLATWFLPNLSDVFLVLSPINLFSKFPGRNNFDNRCNRTTFTNIPIYITYNNCITEKKEFEIKEVREIGKNIRKIKI